MSLGRAWWEDAINEFRSTFIRCERKRKRLMEQKREGSRIFYQNRPKTERIRRRYIVIGLQCFFIFFCLYFCFLFFAFCYLNE